MAHLPQEIEVWYIIPAIRKEFAKYMKEKGIKQSDIANKLDLTIPAVSQYITGKRGKDVDFEPEIIAQIKKSAELIMLDKTQMVTEIQKICYMIRRKGMLCKIAKKYYKVPVGCGACMEH